MGKEKGEVASWLSLPELRFSTGNHKIVCYQLFPSEVSRRFDEVTVHIEIRGTWQMATGYSSYHRPNHFSEFHIGSCQCPKTWLYRKTNVYQPVSHDQRIKIHHSCSCKLSVIHTRWRRNSLTIDMFKFTDVTASHVYYITKDPTTPQMFRYSTLWNVNSLKQQLKKDFCDNAL